MPDFSSLSRKRWMVLAMASKEKESGLWANKRSPSSSKVAGWGERERSKSKTCFSRGEKLLVSTVRGETAGAPIFCRKLCDSWVREACCLDRVDLIVRVVSRPIGSTFFRISARGEKVSSQSTMISNSCHRPLSWA